MSPFARNALRLGCGLPLILVTASVAFTYFFAHRQGNQYRETPFRRDYTWNGIAVGTVTRYPHFSPVPNGRFAVIVAFPESALESQTVLWEGPQGEIAIRPEFLGGDDASVKYKLDTGQIVSFDLLAKPDLEIQPVK